jgi:hypothetical protein
MPVTESRTSPYWAAFAALLVFAPIVRSDARRRAMASAIGPSRANCGVMSERLMIRFPSTAALVILAAPILLANPSHAQAPSPTSACNADCVRTNADKALQPCASQIEAQAPNDFDWISRPYGGIFQEADAPEVPTSSVVRYRGDSIRFLSPQREWSRIIYECTWDAAAAKVIAVKVRIGILGKPNAVATAPMSGARPQEAARPAAAIAPAPSAAPAVAATANKLKIGEPTMTEVRQVTPKPGTVR